MAHRFWLRVALAFVICLIGVSRIQEEPALAAQTGAAQTDESALRAVIEQYTAAYSQKDLAALVRLWSERSPDLAARMQELQDQFSREYYTLANTAVSQVRVQGNKAILQVAADITATNVVIDNARPNKYARGFALVKENDGWRVWRDAPATEDLAVFLTSGGESKLARDPAEFDRLAVTLINTKTDAERRALLKGNQVLLTTELRAALVRRADHQQLFNKDSARVLDIYSIVRMVAEQIDDKRGLAIAETGMAESYWRLGQKPEAVSHYEQALALYQALGDKLQTAATLDQIGTVQLAQRNYAKAMESFQNLLALFEAGKNTVGTASALEAIASVHYEQQNYTRALEFYQKSLRLREATGKRALIAATLNNIGNAYYQQQNYVAAIESYQQAVTAFDPTDDKQAIAAALNNMGSAHYSQGNYEAAREAYQKSFTMAEQLQDRAGQSTSLMGIGLAYYAQGNYPLALEHLQKNLALSQSLNDQNRLAETLHALGLAHARQQNYDLALGSYERSLKLYEEMSNRPGAAVMLNLIGGIHYAQGKYDRALDSYRQALARFDELKEMSGTASSLASIGSVYYAQNSYASALVHYQQSLAQYETLGNKESIAGVIESIASVFYSEGDYAKSLEHAERAAAMAEPSESLETLWRARLTAGADYRALNQTAKAQQSFAAAIAAIEKLREQLVPGERARQMFFKDKSSAYVAMMELLLAQGKTPEAFAYAERVKANRLVDVMESGGARLTKTMTASEQRQEQRLENQIISLKAQIARERERRDADAQRLAALTDGLQKTQSDYRAFEAKLYATHPLLKAARGESLLTKPDAPIVRFDDPQSAMLEFIVTEGRTYLFTLAREQGSGAGGQGSAVATEKSAGALRQSVVSPAPGSRPPAPVLQAYAVEMKRGELAARVAQFRELIDRRDQGAAQAAREVYDILLKQADEQIKNKSAWIIAPDSVLWQLPFQALQPTTSRYVIEDHAISYTPSLAALNEIRKAKPPARVAPANQSALLAFANPVIAPQTVERAKVANKDEQFDALPETENEVKSLAQLYGSSRSRVYVGAQAREQSAKEEAARFRVLHLAAPGVVSDLSPMYSHVALAQTPGKDDGLFEVWEMIQMDCRAELVVWSASETARAATGSGAGIAGLEWSLFAAGCPTLVASQWRTASPGTTELMLAFHSQLQAASNRRERLTKAQALQQAMLKLLKGESYKQPFYWAGFAMIGDGR